MSENTIRFDAQVWAVKTLVDGGLQFVFQVGEDKVMQAAQLMECKRFGVILDITATPLINTEQQESNVKQVAARTKRKSSWKTAEVQGDDGNT